MRDIERTEPVNVAPGQWIIANENGTFRVSTTGPQTETANGLPQTYRSARTVRALVQPFRRSRSLAERQYQRAHSIPKKLTSGRALACSVRNVPFPIPTPSSTA